MEANNDTIKLYYNTEREKLQMPEYGRNILRMVEILKSIEDKEQRIKAYQDFLTLLKLVSKKV